MVLSIVRDGKPMDISVNPLPKTPPKGLVACREHLKWKACQEGDYLLGITFSEDRQRIGFASSMAQAFAYPIVQTQNIASMLKKLRFEKLKGSGPVRSVLPR